ncbi:MAG: AAA family ATPase [Bdellovibrionales bacterium]|nr:AAA family ATPase [Bdellovibrionales bacterium]
MNPMIMDRPVDPREGENIRKNEIEEGESFADPDSFRPEDLQKEFSDLIERKFGGRVQVMAVDPSQMLGEDDIDENPQPAEEILESFHYKPKDIKVHLDRFAIGQDEAKRALAIAVCDHYNHLRNQQVKTSGDSHYQKQNVLILGPTGVGKTYLVKLISQLIGVPFVKADATRFSEVGYMGANVDDVIRDLVQAAGGRISLAEQGIVYVDEVDKLASQKSERGRDVSGRGVQFGFLRLLENADVDLNASHDIASQFKTFMSFQRKGKAEKEIVNTKNILFIFSGAFHGLEDVIAHRIDKKSIGIHKPAKDIKRDELLASAEAEDLVQFGFEHEFVGRLPVRVACHNLSEEDLLKILKQSEHSIVKQYVESFALYGVDLKFTEEALRALAQKAHTQKTGARALNAVFETTLRPFKFELPSTSVTSLEVTAELVANPEGYLHHLLNSL